MKKIITIGEIVVEIMAIETGNGFKSAIPLIGPFASGAPAIFIDQAAKMGQPCGIVSAVGNDDFGTLNIERPPLVALSCVIAPMEIAISSSTSSTVHAARLR